MNPLFKEVKFPKLTQEQLELVAKMDVQSERDSFYAFILAARALDSAHTQANEDNYNDAALTHGSGNRIPLPVRKFVLKDIMAARHKARRGW